MIDTSFLKALDKFALIINKKLTSNLKGERKSLAKGTGTIFKDYRQYTPDDDFKAIDWKVYARSDHLYVKEYEEERNLTVHILVDFSASMDFGEQTKKSEYASMMALGFAYMALKNNEKFVLSTFSDKLDIFRPKKGRNQLVSMLNYLNNKKSSGVSDLKGSIARYGELIRSKSIVIIISDFLYDAEQIRDVLYRLKKSQVKLIQVLDDIELKLNLEGEFNLKDSESKSILKTFIGPFLKRRYFKKLEHHESELKKIALETKSGFYSVNTSKPIFDSFVEIMH